MLIVPTLMIRDNCYVTLSTFDKYLPLGFDRFQPSLARDYIT